TFTIFFHCSRRHSSFLLACAFALLSFPLIAFRNEPRPEGISYLFCGIFLWMLESFRQNKMSSRSLAVAACVVQVIWVNMHIFFIAGPVLTAFFWWQAYGDGQGSQARSLRRLFFLQLAMCLINPSGIKGFLAPFHINEAYAYWILENQPVSYFLKAGFMPWKSFALYFVFTLGLLVAGLGGLIRREGFKKHIVAVSLTALLSLAAVTAVRLIGLYGFFWMPLSAYVYGRRLRNKNARLGKIMETVLLVLGIIVSASVNYNWKTRPFLGLAPGSNRAAEFFKKEKISGPIFNNYDIGGYLIFHLSPRYKLFVDDRMEAFPPGFFSGTYVPMQMDNALWKKMDDRYHFNAIFFSLDVTPWAARFMKDRFADPAWATVYDTDKAIIWLKRNAQNAPVIRRYEIKAVYVQL
ncbi:MAG: hypothetical protein KGJ95_08995, partial [Candidatus Omnitrophica bacterium]|nr:hypothetical protein [Candidatus Omnitrophota bacterium]